MMQDAVRARTMSENDQHLVQGLKSIKKYVVKGTKE